MIEPILNIKHCPEFCPRGELRVRLTTDQTSHFTLHTSHRRRGLLHLAPGVAHDQADGERVDPGVDHKAGLGERCNSKSKHIKLRPGRNSLGPRRAVSYPTLCKKS